MAALDLSTGRKDISQVNGGLRVISDENPRFGIDLKRKNAILRKKFRILKKDRDFHFRNRKKYKRQLCKLQTKYDGLQNYFVTSQLLKELDESHREISRLKEIISFREQESSQNLQVVQPFVNGELTDLQTADVSIDIEEHEEETVKAEPQYVEVEEQDNMQVYEPIANASIKEHEEQIVRDELQEREAEEEDKDEEQQHPYNNSAENEVNSAEFEKREIREICVQNGNSTHSESNLVCKWIHLKKGVCRLEFHHASELESHLKTFHVITAKRTRYRCRWEDCPSNGRPFVVPGKFISHLDEHIPEVSNESQINKNQYATGTESNPRSKNLRRGSQRMGIGTQLKIHDRTHKGKKPFACSYKGCDRKFTSKRALQYHLNRHRGERPFKCPYDGCHWAFANKTNLYGHLRTHTGERPYKCTFKGCGRRFALKSNLKVHWRIHNDGCGKRFRQKSNQMVHFVPE